MTPKWKMSTICKLLFIIALCMPQSGAQNQNPYCDFTPEHTLCKYSGLSPICVNLVIKQGISSEDKTLILHLHNQLRSRVAMGEEYRGNPGPQPQAANMRQMEWDDELASLAQMHANQCVFEHECSDCRRVNRFGVGQNLFMSFESYLITTIEWERAIMAFFNEVDEFSSSHIKPFQYGVHVGHYTQMTWHNTWKIGCGFTMFKDHSPFIEEEWWKKLYTCDYGPAGNIYDGEMYSEGSTCTACPPGTACRYTPPYLGLCENIQN